MRTAALFSPVLAGTKALAGAAGAPIRLEIPACEIHPTALLLPIASIVEHSGIECKPSVPNAVKICGRMRQAVYRPSPF